MHQADLDRAVLRRSSPARTPHFRRKRPVLIRQTCLLVRPLRARSLPLPRASPVPLPQSRLDRPGQRGPERRLGAVRAAVEARPVAKRPAAPRRSESSGQGGTRRAPGPRGLDADAKVDRTTATGSGAVAAEGTVSSIAETPPARRAARESADHSSVRFTASPPLMVVDSTVPPASAATGGGQAGPGATELNDVRPSSVPDAVIGGEAEPQPSPGEPELRRDAKVPGAEAVEPFPGVRAPSPTEAARRLSAKSKGLRPRSIRLAARPVNRSNWLPPVRCHRRAVLWSVWTGCLRRRGTARMAVPTPAGSARPLS